MLHNNLNIQTKNTKQRREGGLPAGCGPRARSTVSPLARRVFLPIILLFWLLFPVLAPRDADAGACAAAAQVKIPTADNPALLIDDGDRQTLLAAAAASLRALSARPADEPVCLGGDVYTMERLRESLRLFLRLAEKTPDARVLARLVRERFSLYQAQGGSGDSGMLVTGYYEPVADGRLAPAPPFLHPLYGLPADLVKDPGGRGCRRQGAELLPYWTRGQIERERLLAGRELVWLADPIEAFLFHIQGSGRVRLADGTLRRIRYAGDNGRAYTGIGSVLIREGKLSRERTTLPAIIDYLRQHPDEEERLLHANDRFIFFQWDEGRNASDGPLGSLGVPLTAGRSVALDQGAFPAGALGFLRTREPIVDQAGVIIGYRPLARFVVNQDKGAAIQGAGRLDLFLGAGPRAMAAAGVMKNPGSLYLLVKK